MNVFDIKQGEVIKVGSIKHKRIFGLVKEIFDMQDETQFTITSCYKPSPKSRLKERNPFTKNKFKLIIA